MKMTITRGLAELKLLDARIKKQTAESVFTDCRNNRSKLTVIKQMGEEALISKAKADFQSIKDLIARRLKIKSEIMAKNSVTKIKIGGQEMTVAEAIDRKTSIEYMKSWLAQMKAARAHVTKITAESNAKIEMQIQNLLNTNLSAQGKAIAESDYEIIGKPLREANELNIIDPLNLAEKIESLEAEIEEFEKEVDFTLSESNSRVEIEV